MFKAGLLKEIKLVSRGFKIWGILLAIFGIAMLYPMLYKFVEVMTLSLEEMATQPGMDIGSTVDSMTGMLGEMAALYGGSLAGVGFYTGISSLTSEGFLVIALLLMATAGGEQKKRSVIMPDCAGLTPAGYVLPKFAIYPLLIGILTFGGVMLTAVMSDAMFEGAVAMENVLFSGACVSIYMVFMISLYLLLGIVTGRPGIAVIIMYLGSALVPILLAAFNITECNPFALRDMLMVPYEVADMENFTISIIVTVILVVISCLISLVVTTLRKIDNSTGEANL